MRRIRRLFRLFLSDEEMQVKVGNTRYGWVCGENYFAEDDVNAIQDTITIIDQQASKLARIA